MLNSVVIMGRLTFEPELRSTVEGKAVMNFTIACDRQYQSAGQERKADFIDCTAWEKTAEFIKRYFHKGSMIAVEGSLNTENYVDNDGNNRKSVKVTVKEVSFCTSKSSAVNPSFAPPDEYTEFEEIED